MTRSRPTTALPAPPSGRHRGGWGLVSAGWAWLPMAASAATDPPPIDLAHATWKIVGWLLVLIAIAAALHRWGKRLPILQTAEWRQVRVVGGCNLAPGAAVRLVQVEERVWMVGVTREQVSLLAELTPSRNAPGNHAPEERSGAAAFATATSPTPQPSEEQV